MKSLKKVLSIILCVMLLISTLTLSASAALTYTEYTWHEPVGVSTLNGYSYVGDDYKFGAPGSAFNAASTIASGNIKLTLSSAATPMCAYFKWDISGYTIDEIVSVRFICITRDNDLNLYSMPEASWSETTAPLLSSGTSITKVMSEDEVPESYFEAYGATWTRRYYDITNAVISAKNNGQASFVLGIESNNPYNTYLGGLNGAKPAIQFKTAEEKVVEATSKSTVKADWCEPIKINASNGKNHGDDFIVGTPGANVSDLTTNISGGWVKLGGTTVENRIVGYFKFDISDYTDESQVDTAIFLNRNDGGTLKLYSIDTWYSDKVPTFTTEDNITYTSSSEPGPEGSETLTDLKKYDITSAVKSAVRNDKKELIIAVERSNTTGNTYFRGMTGSYPALWVKKAVSVDTAATFTGTLAAGNDLTLTYAVDNGWDTDLSVDCIIAVYDSNKALKYVDIETITVSSLDTAGDTFVYTVPADAGDLTGCTAKAMIWNSDFTPLVTVIPLVAVN